MKSTNRTLSALVLASVAVGATVWHVAYSFPCFDLPDCSLINSFDACLSCSEGGGEYCGFKIAAFQQNEGVKYKKYPQHGSYEAAIGIGPIRDCYAKGYCTHGEMPGTPYQCVNEDDEPGYLCDAPIGWEWFWGYDNYDTLDCDY